MDKPAVRDAIAYAEEKRVPAVASAGNDYATDGSFKYYPAGYDTIIVPRPVKEGGYTDCRKKMCGDILSFSSRVNDGGCNRYIP